MVHHCPCTQGFAAWQDCYKPHPLVEATLMGVLALLQLPQTLLEAKVCPSALLYMCSSLLTDLQASTPARC